MHTLFDLLIFGGLFAAMAAGWVSVPVGFIVFIVAAVILSRGRASASLGGDGDGGDGGGDAGGGD